jgi:hypothetical protein
MSQATAPAGAGVPTETVARKKPRRPPLQRLAIRLGVSIVAFGVPAYLVSGFLAELSGGALWLPEQWRMTIKIFGIAMGLACFNLARHRSRPDESPDSNADDDELDSARLLELGEDQRAQDREAQRGALFWYAVSLVCLAGYLGLRSMTAYPWSPTLTDLEGEYGDDNVETALELPNLRAPVFLERQGDSFRGSILDPPRSWLSKETQAKYAVQATNAGLEDPWAFWLRRAPFDVIDQLQRDSLAVSCTVLLFLLIHLAILCSASAGYGYAFSILEEIGGSLV